FKVIGAIEDQVEASEQLRGVAGVEIGDDTFDGDRGVEGAELALSGDGLGQRVAGVGFVEKNLTLQIRRFDEVTVEDADAAYARSDEHSGGRSADGAASNNYQRRVEQSLLALGPEGGEEHLARIPFLEKIAQWVRIPELTARALGWTRPSLVTMVTTARH